MNFHYLTSGLPALAATAFVSLLSVQQASAQQGGPWARLAAAETAIKQDKWDVAYDEVQAAIKAFDRRAAALGIGDKFGQFWYVKGLCEFQLKEYAKAIETFKTGITKYPGKDNHFIGQSYMRMAESAIQMKDFDQALSILNTFIEYRKKGGNNLPQADLDISMGLVYALAAQCNFLAENTNFEEGIRNIKLIASARYTAREGREGKGISDDPIIRAFLAMTEKCIQTDRPELILDFLQTGRSIVALEPWRTADYGKYFFSLANSARDKYTKLTGEKAANMLRVSQELLTLVPDKASVDQSVQSVMARLGDFPVRGDSTVTYDKKAIQAVQKAFDDNIKANKQPWGGFITMFTAADYAGAMSYRPARAAFAFLTQNYPDMPDASKEDNMFYWVTMTTQLGEIERSQELSKDFITKYPNSKHSQNVHLLSLQTMFNEQNYEGGLKLAESVLASNPADSKVKEMAMFVEGGSLFNLGRSKEAVPKLQEFVEAFPRSLFKSQAMYYIGSALFRTGSADRAIHAFNKMTKEFPKKEDSPFLPYALFDRARAASSLDSQDGYEKALVDYDRVIKEFGDSNLFAAANVNRGFLLLDKFKKNEEAKQSFETGLKAAEEAGDKSVMGEALFRLTDMAFKEKNYEATAAYYDRFWKEVGNDPGVYYYYRLVEAVIGLDTLTHVNRRAEGMDRLEKTIVAVSRLESLTDTTQVEAAIASYVKAYLEDVTGKDVKTPVNLEDVKKHFYNFPGVTPQDSNLITMLRIALVGIYESELKKVDKSDGASLAQFNAQIQVIFQDIQKSLEIKNMTPFALFKLGNYLGEKTDHPEQAMPYFEELMKRPPNKFTNDGQFGLAQALSRSDDKAKVEQAVNMMNKVILDEKAKPKPVTATIEKATYYLALFSYNAGDYKQAAKQAADYMKNFPNSKSTHRLAAFLLLAKSNDQLGDVENAIKSYIAINSNYTGAISASAPAMKRAMELFYERNNPKPDIDTPSDRLLAYTIGRRYLTSTRILFDRMSVSERNMWREVESLVQKYGEDPNIAQEDRDASERALLKAGK